jgi:hypothetical protein
VRCPCDREGTLRGRFAGGCEPRARILSAALLVLAACRAPAPTTDEAVEKARHDQEEHAHSAPHGGLVESATGGHLELLVEPGGRFKLFVLDPNLDSRKLPGMTATLLVAIPGYPEVTMGERWDGLEGRGPALLRQRFAVVAVLRAAEVQESARFVVDFAAGAGGGTPHHHQAPPEARRPGVEFVVGQVVDAGCQAPPEPRPQLRGAEDAVRVSDPEDCARRRAGGEAALTIVEEGSGRVYLPKAAAGISLATVLGPLVGRRCQVFGKILRGPGPAGILVEAAVPEHDHGARHEGGGVTMVGERHLEAVAYTSGEVRIYLSDVFRQPLKVTGYRGTVELHASGGSPRTAPLEPAAGDAFLRAMFPPLGRAVEITVRLPMRGDPSYFITFQLGSQAGAPPG